jgi:uncharacterized peroxidase-related enzyme
MARLPTVSPESATGKAKELLQAVHAKLGMVPNMIRTMATAPAVLDGYLQLSGALAKGALPAKAREQLALAIGEANQCDYCVAAHSAIGKTVGLTGDQIRDSRLGTAVDAKTDALIRFAREVVDARGQVTDQDIRAVREAGFRDSTIAEVVAHVALNIFTNYFNQVARTDIDFPKAPALTPEPATTA